MLCAVATIVMNGSKTWVQWPVQFADEAKRRGLDCGVQKNGANVVKNSKESMSVAQSLYKSQNAISHFQLIQLAIGGDPESMYYISLNFAKGGIQENYSLSKHWLNRAAEAGWEEAQYELGKKFHLGNDGYPIDIEIAEKWYKKASASGHLPSVQALKKLTDDKNKSLQQRELSGPWTGDTGFIILDGIKYSFFDIEVMEWSKYINKNVIVYGYFRFFDETTRPGFGYRFLLFDGKNKNEDFPVEIEYSAFHKPNEGIASAKKRALLPLREADARRGISYLLELKGKFRTYANLDNIYFEPAEIRMIPDFKG